MRKSLLMTSVLGLAMPALAMANAAAAGSSSAVCGSGFFAQFDAKIMNAKLEIKNEKGNKSAVEDAAKIGDDDIISEIKENSLNALKNVEVVPLLDVDFASAAAKAAAINTLNGYALADIASDTKIDGKITTDFGAASADQKTAIKQYLQTARAVGEGFESATLVSVVFTRRLESKGDTRFVYRGQAAATGVLGGAPESQVDVLVKLSAGSLTDFGEDFRPIKTIYVIGATNNGPALVPGDLETAARTQFAGDPFKVDMGNLRSGALNAQVKSIKDERVKLNAERDERKKLEVFDRRVHHHALAGGVGATVGWWQNLGGFALSISGSGDYLWGTFRAVDDKAGNTVKAEDKRKLGFGFQGDIGAHYIVSPSTTLGILVGLRGQQLNIGRTNVAQSTTANSKDSKGDYASKWMINPVVTLQARTFFTDTVYGALSVSYVIPIEKDYKVKDTNIDEDAKVRFQGLTGAFSVGMMF